VLRYGDEIGMGDDLTLPERDAVRTPMQWTAGANGGFSTAPPHRLVRQLVAGEYGPGAVNVADQQRDPGSLLNWLQRALGVRHACPEIGWGTARLLAADVPGVLAIRCDRDGLHAAIVPAPAGGGAAAHPRTAVVTLHNLAPTPCTVRLSADGTGEGDVTELLADRVYERAVDLTRDVPVGAYGYRWFRIALRRGG
jgi:maltose alpha-D-glucosyltransferase/alpha-amylase